MLRNSSILSSDYDVSIQEGIAVASIARDVVVEMTPPREHNARKFGSEFETLISHNAPMHFRHKQTDRQTDTDIVA